MSKKLTKTIILIVFVVFLGIKNVDAKVYKTCIYERVDKPSNKITISINTGFEAQITAGGIDNLINWTKEIKGVSGYNYFNDNNHACPPYFIFVDYATTENGYFATEDTKEEIKKYGKEQASLWKDDAYEYKLASELLEENYDDAPVNEEAASSKSLTCSCSSTSGKSFSLKFTVGGNLSQPRVSYKFDGSSGEENIKNWNSKLSGTNYTYLDDYTKNNKCPSNAVLTSSPIFGTHDFYLSDDKNLDSIKKNAADEEGNFWGADADVYVAACKEVEEEKTTPSNSNSNKPPKEYDDPSVGYTVTPLSEDLTTYSCGNNYVQNIPSKILRLTKFIYNFVQVLVPIAIVLLGSIDLVKAVAGQKDDEIQKGYKVLIKRLVAAVIVFFVLAIVKLLISIVSDNSSGIIDCVDCFLKFNNSCIME